MNYSEPTLETRMELEVGVSYDVPPNQVKATILGGDQGRTAARRRTAPEVLIVEFRLRRR